MAHLLETCLSCTLLLLLRQLNVLPNQINNHLLERLSLDPKLLLSLADVTLQDRTRDNTVVGQQTALDSLREMLLSVLLGVVPLWKDLSVSTLMPSVSVVK
jgi:hypothetical protein